jgi:integrase
MKLAMKWGYRPDNPMLNVDPVQHKSKGIRTWTEDDIAKFRARWAHGTPQRVAFEILLYTGLRRSDAVRLGRQHVQGDFIVIHTKKSGEMVELNIPIHHEFGLLLESINHGHLNFIATAQGAARSEKAFTNWVIDAAREAGLPPHSSPHGLRKAACRRLAEAGCSTLEIMAITGHRNLKEVETYVKAVNQRRLAMTAVDKRAKGA